MWQKCLPVAHAYAVWWTVSNRQKARDKMLSAINRAVTMAVYKTYNNG